MPRDSSIRCILFILLAIASAVTGMLNAQPGAPPEQPLLVHPVDQSAGNPTGVTLSVEVNDPDPGSLSVTFFGRKQPTPDDDFTVIDLPDTQYYTGVLNGGSPEMFYSQTQWIVDHRQQENIVYVVQNGDCVEHGDDIEDEWKRADTAMQTIEDPVTTLLDDGIPYAVAVGNHDQTPWGDPNGTTALFNTYFGVSRFAGRDYYGGHFGTDNNNSFQFFSAGSMDFLVIILEYDPGADPMVLQWVDSLLTAHPERRAILVSHYLIAPGNPGNFGTQGQAIYNKVKDNDNVILMLGAHFPGEGRRSDTFNGHVIHTLLADYQMRTNGGNGWMRLLRFSPVSNTISVRTYSPWLDAWEEDDDSQFDLPLNMDDAGLVNLGTMQNVVPGSTVDLSWGDLDPWTTYEWFVMVSDGTDTIIGPRWSFSTGDHQLALKVLLEGPYADGMLDTGLENAIPLIQPYNTPPWNYPGSENITTIPTGMADWVLVELRDAPNAPSADSMTRIFRMAGILKNNGEVVATDGISPLPFPVRINQQLFAVIRHRNHLAVLSATPLNNVNGVFQYDFTAEGSATYGGEAGCSLLPGNLWGMTAGDVNSDGTIDTMDLTGWTNSAGFSGYLLNDLNLDQQTDNRDKNSNWLHNLGKSSQVPE